MANRVPFFVRLLSFAIAAALLYLLWWVHADSPEHRLTLQTDLAFGSLALAALVIASWPKNETAWRYKVAIMGLVGFLAGAIWMAALNPYNTLLTGFPWVLLYGMVLLGVTVIVAPNRHFVSTRC